MTTGENLAPILPVWTTSMSIFWKVSSRSPVASHPYVVWSSFSQSESSYSFYLYQATNGVFGPFTRKNWYAMLPLRDVLSAGTAFEGQGRRGEERTLDGGGQMLFACKVQGGGGKGADRGAFSAHSCHHGGRSSPFNHARPGTRSSLFASVTRTFAIPLSRVRTLQCKY